MKRLLSVCLLMLCLSLPAFAGHTLGGGYCSTCPCNGCICDPGEQPSLCIQGNRAVTDSESQDAPLDSNYDFDLGPEVMLGLFMVLLMLRLRA